MILPLEFVNKIHESNMNIINEINESNTKIINEYVCLKYKKNFNFNNSQIKELAIIWTFFKEYLTLILDSIKNISCFVELFKHEHDCLLFFKNNNKFIIIDLEVKNDSKVSEINEQIKSHLSFLATRLEKNKYELYGLSYIYKKKYSSIYAVKNSNNGTFKISQIRQKFTFILNNIIKKKFVYIDDPSSIIKSMEGDINQIIDICKEKKISLTSGEKDLVDWINKELSSKDLIIIQANAGIGKTTILLKLFFNDLYMKSCVLFNNIRIKSLISLNNSCYEKKGYFFYKANDCMHENIEILLIDEAQRLNFKQIMFLLSKFKKIIFFGDKYQAFDRKYDCNYGEKLYQQLSETYVCAYKEYISDTNRRFSKNFPIVIKHILNNKKYKLPNKMSCTSNINESIFMYDEIDAFLESYCSIENNKKMFSESKFNSKIYSLEKFYSKGISSLYGRGNPTFAFDSNFESVGTAYNAFSFEIDYVFLIIESESNIIKTNKYVFNQLYTLATRARKELHILFLNKNIECFCKMLSIIRGVD